ncbi:uncharacterized protein LOC34621501 [Cyclospora cayetanensis]|uniref:Uncharacterized protein LOC34621501 n=2 Tax=Cyclospora cayetanensis TaxID=88456 RepID=A0A6P5WDW3_9EIME|nr:uncharacterized protein LOC34621501 [Cyclospora cayetanensis]OEH79455.1 putative DnaJ domain-containing protein [Cyclospora cayetanensis]
MTTGRCALPEGLQGLCPYTLLGLCLPEHGRPVSVQECAFDEAAIRAREGLAIKAIGTAYRKAALRAHPDKNKGREAEAGAEFVKVNLAFAFLSDASQREAYHKHLQALLSLRQEREQQKLRWTAKDKERQRLKAELERREAEARKGPKVDSEAELLKEIREQNENLLRRKKQERDAMRRECFRQNSVYQQQHWQPQAPLHSQEAAEAEDDLAAILYRSVLLSWLPAAKAEADNAEEAVQGGRISRSKAVPPEVPTPELLCSLLVAHGAIDLCLFSKSKGQACISFTSRERAIESALLLQRQCQSNTGGSKAHGLSAKLANKVKGLEALLQRVRNIAGVVELHQQQKEDSSGGGAATTNEEDEEALNIAEETEKAAAAFAAALAAAQEEDAAHSFPKVPFSGVQATQADTLSSRSAARSKCNGVGELSTAQVKAVAAAFGLGGAQGTSPTSGAAGRILEYVRACSDRGRADAAKQQAEADIEKGWEWLGGSKVAASMSLQQLEAAAFGALERKKQQFEST